MSELVSVIIPTYNRVDYLPDALESVRAQTYRPIEVLVVDDGSTDETKAWITDWSQQYSAEDFIVRYLVQENQGAPVARNYGVREAAGKYVQFLDSDDALGTGKLTHQVAYLQDNSELALVYGPIFCMEDKQKPWVLLNREMAATEALRCFISLEPSFFHTMNSLFRKDTLAMLGPWDETLPRLQDVELGFRFVCMGLPYGFCEEGQCYSRAHDDARGQISSKARTADQLAEIARLQSYLLSKHIPHLPAEFLGDVENCELLTRCLMGAVIGCSYSVQKEFSEDAMAHVARFSKGTSVARQAKLFLCLFDILGPRIGTRVYHLLERAYALTTRGKGTA
ncbi:hypothetical protein BVY04_01280 [bacterium M21]|nr:hypothetical protein BVY04_01280 [bacterium M21]